MNNNVIKTNRDINPIRPKRGYNKRKIDIENYLKMGLSAAQIAKKLNCQISTITYYMREKNDNKQSKLSIFERKIKNFMYHYRNKQLTKEIVIGFLEANKFCKVSNAPIDLNIDNYHISFNKSSGLPFLYLKEYHVFVIKGINNVIDIAIKLLKANKYTIIDPPREEKTSTF